MTPFAVGQIARFHTPLPDESPDQLYQLLELHTDVEKPRCLVVALNTGMTLAPTNTVLLEALEIVNPVPGDKH